MDLTDLIGEILALAAVAALAMIAIARKRKSGGKGCDLLSNPARLLQERLKKGEITKEEFDEKMCYLNRSC